MNVGRLTTFHTDHIDDKKLHGKHIILLGSPGAGKSTISQFLEASGSYAPFPLGDILRTRVECKPYLDAGALVPTDICLAIFKEAFALAQQQEKLIIVDGMIQSQFYYKYFEEFMNERALRDKFCFVFLNISQEAARDRLLHRVVCQTCRRVYTNKTIQCKHCKNDLATRVDDAKEKTIQARLDRFWQGKPETPAAISFVAQYRDRSHFVEFNAELDVETLQTQYRRVFL